MRVLFVCGGTAGHINPALAIAAALKKFSVTEILFVGSGRELENKLIPDAGYRLVNIKMTGISRGMSPKSFIRNFKTMFYLLLANKESKKLLNDFKPQAVIGTGGYICYPVLKRASKMGIRTLIHESNAVPGLTTKLLSIYVDKVLTAFPGQERFYKYPNRVLFTGTPVREGFVPAADFFENKKEDEKPLLISFWGSLGAERLNDMMPEFIKLNIAEGSFRHIHATGKGGAEILKERLFECIEPQELPIDIDIREYIDDLPKLMAEADIVLCRAGASTVAELIAARKPAVLVPSPYVTGNHQTYNAKELQKAGGVVMISEMDCSGELLYNTVIGLFSDKTKLKTMSEAYGKLGLSNAAEVIAEIINDEERLLQSVQ